MLLTIVLILFFLLLLIGVPIYLVLSGLAVLTWVVEGAPLVSLGQQYANHLNSYTLVAVPLFVIAATFMQRGGVAKALIDMASAWVGRTRGALGIVCILATAVFAAISGSSVATALAIGAVLIPAMKERGYPITFATGTIGAGGTLGILIPPSLAMLIYGIIVDESVPRLFLAGVVPGLLQAALLMVYVRYYAVRYDLPVEEAMDRDQFIHANLNALPALLVPIIILGGIYSGLVTISEAAGLSAIVALIVSLTFYREIRLRDVLSILADGVRQTGVIIFIVLAALTFAHWLTGAGVTRALVNFIDTMDLSPWEFLIAANVIMFVLGMFLEVISVILIFVPLVVPALLQLGINPIHFGVILVVNMEIALLTPPVGLNLFVLKSVANTGIDKVIRGVTPYILLMLCLLVFITFVPAVSTWLPDLVFGKN
ncbi:TRAP transporter large permease [Puniceibacterium sp. IMCC21224]|uniref:TRAP transporter large permease n=1 Tax=Puniceibacterium sp. IMCC21224 TaxID=1618204 RepID=UPI00064D7F43|nr:TRAP transporter large permease [Puniceibacterium sp. IMCC21224]KMK68271.1 TRAP transporter, DctM subunit [Puniceibacterium sp. IMCC21224]